MIETDIKLYSVKMTRMGLNYSTFEPIDCIKDLFELKLSKKEHEKLGKLIDKLKVKQSINYGSVKITRTY